MKKFAAHYLLTDQGLLLKNGIAVVTDNRTLEFIDTKGELAEMEQMIFHSGLLISAFEFTKEDDFTPLTSTEELLPLFYPILHTNYLTIEKVVDLARQLQHAFPQMNISDLLNKTEQVLLINGFVKKTIQSLYLLLGLDLKTLRFTEKTKLKKIV